MDTNRITKQALLYKPKGGETWDDRGKDGRIKFTSSVKEQSFDGDSNELLPFLHPAYPSAFFPSAHDALSRKLTVYNYKC